MLTLSIDANFGLCRKKNAGTSVRDPLSGTSMFCEQEMVDEFILSSTSGPTTSITDKVVRCM